MNVFKIELRKMTLLKIEFGHFMLDIKGFWAYFISDGRFKKTYRKELDRAQKT